MGKIKFYSLWALRAILLFIFYVELFLWLIIIVQAIRLLAEYTGIANAMIITLIGIALSFLAIFNAREYMEEHFKFN